MRHSRTALALAALVLVLALPATGSANHRWYDCEGFACAAVSADGDGARVDWQGGNIDVGRHSGTFARGGTSVSSFSGYWLGISLHDPNTGQQTFNCWRPLDQGTFTWNPDGSASLTSTDPGCQASVTWSAPPSEGVAYLYWNVGGNVDPNSGSASVSPSLYLAQHTVAYGTAAGQTIGDDWQNAETHRIVGTCATNQSCGF